MIDVTNHGVYLLNGREVVGADDPRVGGVSPEKARKGTIAYSVLSSHNTSKSENDLKIKFDSLVSHDITYVGIIQTARASGLRKFPVRYSMTNCHNSLCAVGGTINEDDHIFGLSAAKKYGGVYVPANQAVIHQFARETMTGCGKMILGSDSHTRYGAMGTMGIGEGGPELVKQLLSNTYDIKAPQVVLVYLKNKPRKGIGPHDVALALCKAVFKDALVTNKVLEFVGPGVRNLPMDFRIGIDVMTTETACLSSIWETDETVRNFYINHGRSEEYRQLHPADIAYYDGLVTIDLEKIESMIALPFHPSNAYTIHELQADPIGIFRQVEENAKAQFGDKVDFRLTDKVVDGKIMVDQGVIAGCSGGMFDSICGAADILDGGSTGDGYFSLSIYPSSVPVDLALIRNGVQARLLESGAVFKPSFCGPCFGAGDVPGNNCLSIRHTTRNFPNREGSKPGDGQLAAVALVDALSIAATARNKGVLTAATDIDYNARTYAYTFDGSVYDKRVYNGFGKADESVQLRLGPNITDWPKMYKLEDNLLVKLASVIHDDVTTTDELIPSGETSSYRSNPLKLSEFALSRRDPQYVLRSKAIAETEKARRDGKKPAELMEVLSKVCGDPEKEIGRTQFGSCVFAKKPGDGSAREQAASCQKVLGGFANICYEFATKRYRSNCINWGILPFTIDKSRKFDYSDGDYVFVPGIREKIRNGEETFPAKVITADGRTEDITLYVRGLTDDERAIILEGCLMNYYKSQSKQ
ncbi:MAG: hydratase [Oscillospiraceae bacterium]|nr:hydratase [Oscillospiraceae bacterium]